MSEDDWVQLALKDSTLVAELLMQLRRGNSERAPPARSGPRPALGLDWSVKQRRSRSVSRHSSEPKKSGDAARASPTTPLSWSGGTSVSGGGGGIGGGGGGATVAGGAVDGCEESTSKPQSKAPHGARSKAVATGETPNNNKRSRRKKTLAELKEEESLLLKEKRKLKNELAVLHMNVEKQRATNESLKRMKLDLLSRPAREIVGPSSAAQEAILDQHQRTEAACETDGVLPTSSACNGTNAVLETSAPDMISKRQEMRNQEAGFMLPDLNMPVEEDSNPAVLYGVS